MQKSSIRPDRVQPKDLLERNLIYSCEDCTYFNNEKVNCILGLNVTPHLKKNQLKKMELSGQMLFCRFIENA